ncbi:hypothetical protein GCM10027615_26630 [Plantactinospora veratri]
MIAIELSPAEEISDLADQSIAASQPRASTARTSAPGADTGDGAAVTGASGSTGRSGASGAGVAVVPDSFVIISPSADGRRGGGAATGSAVVRTGRRFLSVRGGGRGAGPVPVRTGRTESSRRVAPTGRPVLATPVTGGTRRVAIDCGRLHRRAPPGRPAAATM